MKLKEIYLWKKEVSNGFPCYRETPGKETSFSGQFMENKLARRQRLFPMTSAVPSLNILLYPGELLASPVMSLVL